MMPNLLQMILYSVLIIIFVILKFYLPIFLILKNKIFNFFNIEIKILLVSSILGFLFIRIASFFSPNHQSIIYYFISMLALFIILYYFLVEEVNFRYLAILLFIGITNFSFTEDKNLSIKNSYYNISKNELRYLSLDKINKCSNEQFDKFRPNNYTKLSSLILSSGKKLHCNKHNDFLSYDEYTRVFQWQIRP